MLHARMQDVASCESLTKNCKLLIIEDNKFERLVLRHVLEGNGFVHIEEAKNGIEGFEKIRNNKPDLIILDIEMPQMNGIEFCRKLTSDPALKYIPIIVQTGRTRSEDKQQIFSAGACDYVAKPIDQTEFIARVHSHLERSQWFSQLVLFHSRVQEELTMASKTQQVLIPSTLQLDTVSETYQIEIKHFEMTSSELGGDFWGVHQLTGNKLIIYMIDFSGHGINAALNTFRLHTLMQQLYVAYEDPGEYMTRLNSELAALLPTGQFCTMFYGVIDTLEQTLHYATASCPAPLIIRKNGPAEIVDGSGFLFGTIPNLKYETKHTSFSPGDMLLLYSDALTESPDINGNLLTEPAIVEYFSDNKDIGFENLITTINTQYDKAWPDDLTIAGFYFLT